jgi:neurofibromin 1
LVEDLEMILSTSHNSALLREVNALMCAVSKNPMFTNRKSMKKNLDLLLDGLGLGGIWTSTSFKSTKDREKRCAYLTDKLIEVCLA